MRRVVLKENEKPPVEWLAKAAEAGRLLREAAAFQLNRNIYQIQLFAAPQSSASLPSTGRGSVVIGEWRDRLRVRVFDSVGLMVVDAVEGEREDPKSSLSELCNSLQDDWDATQWKAKMLEDTYVLCEQIAREWCIAKVIKANENVWQNTSIRDWLYGQFGNKCWYSEAKESVSSMHVDHYRPKGRVADDLTDVTETGYWWLAFDWENYRLCGQLLNVKKRDVFPFADAVRSDENGQTSLKLEAPILIDPLTEQTRFVSFELLGSEDCRAVEAEDVSPEERAQATRTIEILGLNRLPKLNQKRASFWQECRITINEYRSAPGEQALRKVAQGLAVVRLKRMITYDAEFSSVVEACLYKNAPDALRASVFSSNRN